MKIIIENYFGSDDIILDFPNILSDEPTDELKNILNKNGYNIADFDEGALRVQAVEVLTDSKALSKEIIEVLL